MSAVKWPRFTLNDAQPLAGQVYVYLRTLIIENTLVAETPLSENDLSARLKVSRQPVREALARLSREHLIDIKPQKGSFVKKISVSGLRSVCFVRSSIECGALRESLQLPQTAFNKIVTRLERNLEQQRRIVPDKNRSYARFLKLDDDFHGLLCSFSQNAFAWDLIQSIKGNLDRIRFFTFAHISRVDHLCNEHQAVVDKIKAQEIEAACQLLRQHLYVITDTYKQAIEEHEMWFMPEDVRAYKRSR